jgi:hypothetical protein
LQLASSSSSSSVAFYVASDSIKHIAAFASGIGAAVASDGRGGRKTLAVVTAEILNNTTDSTTVDTFADLMMLSLCDDMIGTEFSTFTSLAAALGAHRPVIVGARAALRFGRNSIIRVSSSIPIRNDVGEEAVVPNCYDDMLACESLAVVEPYFNPFFMSKLGHMNLTWTGKCRTDLWPKEVNEAKRWYDSLYDVILT